MSGKRILLGVLISGLIAMPAWAARPGAGGPPHAAPGRHVAPPGPRGLGPDGPRRPPAVAGPNRGHGIERTDRLGPPPRGELGIKPPAKAKGALEARPRVQPFTPAWYAQHPHAWHVAHPHADVVVVGAAGLAGWLALPAVTATTVEGSSTAIATTVVETAPTEASAQGLEVSDGGEWMSMGAFDLTPEGARHSTALLTLYVSKEGVLRGTYYDRVSDSAYPLEGRIDKTALRFSWTVGDRASVVFSGALEDLTKPLGTVTVQYAQGQQSRWELRPMKPTENAKP